MGGEARAGCGQHPGDGVVVTGIAVEQNGNLVVHGNVLSSRLEIFFIITYDENIVNHDCKFCTKQRMARRKAASPRMSEKTIQPKYSEGRKE